MSQTGDQPHELAYQTPGPAILPLPALQMNLMRAICITIGLLPMVLVQVWNLIVFQIARTHNLKTVPAGDDYFVRQGITLVTVACPFVLIFLPWLVLRRYHHRRGQSYTTLRPGWQYWQLLLLGGAAFFAGFFVCLFSPAFGMFMTMTGEM